MSTSMDATTTVLEREPSGRAAGVLDGDRAWQCPEPWMIPARPAAWRPPMAVVPLPTRPAVASSPFRCALADNDASSFLVDLLELTKPRMNFLIVLTTLVGFMVGSRLQHPALTNWPLLGSTLLGTALTAAAAGVLNQWLERPFDALMPRTHLRPLPTGRVTPRIAMDFGITLAGAGLVVLFVQVNALTALLGAFTLAWYLLLYTPLKRHTSWNTLIGAVPGAIPPLMGFTAAQDRISWAAMAVFAILFAWQLPHFMAIAIMYRDDYTAGGFRMLPCVDPDLQATGRSIITWAALLLPISLWPVLLHSAGLWYGVAALLLGIAYLGASIRCAKDRTRASARRLFFTSIIHLPLLLTVLVIDRA
jgi:protoheme IX farnesyltransferase